MRYLILIHSNPRSRALWETLTDEQRMEFGRGYMALSAEIEAAGEMVISNGLTDLALAKRVWVQDGETMTSDGPFAEVKEYVAGFLLLDTETESRRWPGRQRRRTRSWAGPWRSGRCST